MPPLPESPRHAAPAHGRVEHALSLRLNGEPYESSVEPWVMLLDMLRERAGLTGTKKGCDHGQCGACTVLVDGERVLSCLTLALTVDGAEVTTVEGLSRPSGEGQGLHPLQQAFIDCDALQCGYCTPGQLCSAAGLLNEAPPVNENEVRERMSGNLCRCGAYPQIVEAVSRVVFHRAPAAAGVAP
jgi:xanthine dehydrogenase YagT iron-sulfur-binding subunit